MNGQLAGARRDSPELTGRPKAGQPHCGWPPAGWMPPGRRPGGREAAVRRPPTPITAGGLFSKLTYHIGKASITRTTDMKNLVIL